MGYVICLLFFLIVFCIFIIFRLNIYVENLEKKVKEQTILTGNLYQSVKDIVAEDMLQNDGRLKKFVMQRDDRHFIFNGSKVQEEKFEF